MLDRKERKEGLSRKDGKNLWKRISRDTFPDQFPEQSLDKPTIPRNPCWILLPLSRGLRFARYKSDVIFSTSVLTSGGKREPVHSRNPFCRNSPHINISAEVGHVRWQITEVENKESGEMFQGSRLTHRELETRVDLLNDPSPVSSPLFFFPPPLVFPPPSLTFPPHVVSFARAINIANPKQAAASNCD